MCSYVETASAGALSSPARLLAACDVNVGCLETTLCLGADGYREECQNANCDLTFSTLIVNPSPIVPLTTGWTCDVAPVVTAITPSAGGFAAQTQVTLHRMLWL